MGALILLTSLIFVRFCLPNPIYTFHWCDVLSAVLCIYDKEKNSAGADVCFDVCKILYSHHLQALYPNSHKVSSVLKKCERSIQNQNMRVYRTRSQIQIFQPNRALWGIFLALSNIRCLIFHSEFL